MIEGISSKWLVPTRIDTL